MRQTNKWLIAITMVACIQLSGCEKEEVVESDHGPVKVESIPGSKLHRIILTAQAANRIDVQTVTPKQQGTAKVIPYDAVLYDPQGKAWVYTETAKLTYVRAPITIESINGNEVMLTNGPALNTKIVTVGTSELYGSEFIGNIQES